MKIETEIELLKLRIQNLENRIKTEEDIIFLGDMIGASYGSQIQCYIVLEKLRKDKAEAEAKLKEMKGERI